MLDSASLFAQVVDTGTGIIGECPIDADCSMPPSSQIGWVSLFIALVLTLLGVFLVYLIDNKFKIGIFRFIGKLIRLSVFVYIFILILIVSIGLVALMVSS